MSTALLIVDVQNDFTEGGALGVDGGTAVAAGVARLLGERRGDYDLVIASRDWHDGEGDNGGHFAVGDEPDFADTWPEHCVAGSPGAEYHPHLDPDVIDVHVLKGQGRPAYSAFEGVTDDGRPLRAVLDERGVTEIDMVGIATDYCVRASALDAIAHGRHVRLFTDLLAGVDERTTDAALAELAHAGAVLAESGDRS